MSGQDDGSQGGGTRFRRWLWLDRTQRTDYRHADRGFYPGGPPVYVSRRAPSRRSMLAVVAAGIVISVIILGVRDADALPADGVVLEGPGIAVALHADND